MPFTLSHAAAVLPIAGRARLVPAALVIGSWAPDLPYFVAPHRGSAWSHSVTGPFTIDLAMGLAVFLVWEWLLRRPLSDLAPERLRSRLPAPIPLSRQRFCWAAASVVIGAITHVVWDSFTHPDRWGTALLPGLNGVVAGLALFTWLQYASSVLGLVIIGWWVLHWASHAPRGPGLSRAPQVFRWGCWAAVGVLTANAAMRTLIAQTADGSPTQSVAFRIITAAMATGGAALVAVSVAWYPMYGGRPASARERGRSDSYRAPDQPR